jgi:uncharacterized protein (DUF305 family)
MALSACGRSDEPANNVAAESDMNSIMADPANPFAASEMKMHDAMMAAIGTNAGDSWVKKMVEHHRGAVEMSQILLDQGLTGHVANMARQTIDKQNKEIEALQKLVASGNPDPASARPYAAAEKHMHDAMMAAKGADVSDTFIRKMLEHHKGAVALSEVALANGASGAVRTQIEKTIAEQKKEIEHLEGMLSGQSAPDEQTAPAAGSTPANSPAPAKPAAEKPKAAATTPAKSAPATNAAESNASETCAPEHRAAGHC